MWFAILRTDRPPSIASLIASASLDAASEASSYA